jgi:hypothetical protein
VSSDRSLGGTSGERFGASANVSVKTHFNVQQMLAEEEAASEDDHQEDRTTQDEYLEHLEHLATEEHVGEGEDAQGVQDAQANHAPEYEQLAKCIHDVPGGW